MQGAPRLPEFIIRIRHPEPEHATNVHFDLNIKYVGLHMMHGSLNRLCLARLPKGYPKLTVPVFAIHAPTPGVKPSQLPTLSNAIHARVQHMRDVEMVFDVSNLLDQLELRCSVP